MYLNLLYLSNLIFCLPTGYAQDQECGNKEQTDQDIDSNIIKVCEELRDLDKQLTKMYQDPPDDKGDDMLRLTKSYNQASQKLLSLSDTFANKQKVVKLAKDILDHGGPHFLDVNFEEEKLKDAFKWEQDTMDFLSMLRLKIGEHWFDLWNMNKHLPDYDVPAN